MRHKFIGPYCLPPCILPRRITVTEIQRKVAGYYGLPVAMMSSECRMRMYSWPRQAAMYLSRLHTKASLPMIAERFGGRDHTTVIHALRAVEARRARFPEYDDQIREAEALL